MVQSENEAIAGGGAVVASGGFSRDRPPEDDCCPICFDGFSIPCRTSCGHWFCSSCMLRYWRYSRPQYRQCKCPICGKPVSELIPFESGLVQQGEEIGKVLKDVQHYNRLHVGGLRGVVQKTLAIAFFIWRGFREPLNQPDVFAYMYNSTRVSLMSFLASHLYHDGDFHIIPNGPLGIAQILKYCVLALVIFLFLDHARHHWKLRNAVQHRPAANVQ